MNIKPHKYNKAIRISIELNQFIKYCEENDLQWFLKLFGTYKLQAWFDKKVKEARKANEHTVHN